MSGRLGSTAPARKAKRSQRSMGKPAASMAAPVSRAGGSRRRSPATVRCGRRDAAQHEAGDRGIHLAVLQRHGVGGALAHAHWDRRAGRGLLGDAIGLVAGLTAASGLWVLRDMPAAPGGAGPRPHALRRPAAAGAGHHVDAGGGGS
jgi:hypothetical protein